ncbi:hypothetical protein TNIN_60511 [Trichonephila inaurata madagascariensis]|uniref:Uncharacterized protein n=1 Tax=Trichonephila inaurata madagascariensis TaxID=2747483 RepID=A0A8X6KLS3_9ARAC|nr:hypothetical protein TNIN_60511 [Trichonephila inaurata madagascariensis]
MKMMSPSKRSPTTCIPHQAAHNNEARSMPEIVGDRNHRIHRLSKSIWKTKHTSVDPNGVQLDPDWPHWFKVAGHRKEEKDL